MEEMKKLADFLFEIGTMRGINRSHSQTLLDRDLSDNNASHSYRVSVIGIFLAQIEQANIERVVLMCITHDWPETRSGDHNHVHKRYVSINTSQIIADQSAVHGSDQLDQAIAEYEKRETKEAIIAKDSDIIDQILLLKEYEWKGAKEAGRWLGGINGEKPYDQLENLKLESSRALGKAIYDTTPSSWWSGLGTRKNIPFVQK